MCSAPRVTPMMPTPQKRVSRAPQAQPRASCSAEPVPRPRDPSLSPNAHTKVLGLPEATLLSSNTVRILYAHDPPLAACVERKVQPNQQAWAAAGGGAGRANRAVGAQRGAAQPGHRLQALPQRKARGGHSTPAAPPSGPGHWKPWEHCRETKGGGGGVLGTCLTPRVS